MRCPSIINGVKTKQTRCIIGIFSTNPMFWILATFWANHSFHFFIKQCLYFIIKYAWALNMKFYFYFQLFTGNKRPHKWVPFWLFEQNKIHLRGIGKYIIRTPFSSSRFMICYIVREKYNWASGYSDSNRFLKPRMFSPIINNE